MALSDLSSALPSLTEEMLCKSLDIHIEEDHQANVMRVLDVPTSSVYQNYNIPKPPPPPIVSYTRTKYLRKLSEYASISNQTKYMWDKLFKQGCDADVLIVTEEDSFIPVHSTVLIIAAPVLGNFLQKSKVINGMRYIKIPAIPFEAVYVFIRFLYSSCYDEEEMEKFVLHLLVMSHSYSVPSLKRVCVYFLERGWLNKDNVIDVLQLARNCDAPRLSLICVRMVMKDFKTISKTDGWKVMKQVNPALEQELVESVIEADTRKQERLKKREERKVYIKLYEAMEALLHICRDGCRTIGPRDKLLEGSQVPCSFPACKGLETLVRHFSNCKIRVPGGCVNCKRMWQLFELHSRMCNNPESCKVPLCRHFMGKIRKQSKKDKTKWKLLVSKVIAARNALGPFSARHTVLL